MIAGDLLETVVGRLDPPFRLAKLEGDAAFLFVEDGRADGSLLLDSLEASYVAFRRRLRSIDAATACDCDSCRLAPRLDLKLFAHHGSYVHSRIAGHDELAGSDVILVHRLLKGPSPSAPGAPASPSSTSAAVEALELDPAALGLTPAEESVEHLGQVSTWVWDLEARWQAESAKRRIDGSDGASILDLESSIAADPSVVWEHLTAPSLRGRWEGPIVIEETVVGGARGLGTVTQCVTGRLATLEEIVDWQPFEHIGWRLAVPDLGPVTATADLEAIDGGTRLRLRWAGQGDQRMDADAIARVRTQRESAIDRLAQLISGASPIPGALTDA